MGDNTHKKLRRSDVWKRIAVLSLVVAMVITSSIPAFAADNMGASNATSNNSSETTTVEEEATQATTEQTEEAQPVTEEESAPATVEENNVPATPAEEATPAETTVEEEEQASTTTLDEDFSEASFEIGKAELLTYDPLFIAKYASDKYVNIESFDLDSFVNIVTAAKGIATYNSAKDYELKDNLIAGMTYELPVYDVDANSKYYVAIPNVNKFDGNNFQAFGLDVAYNNDFAEKINGWKYEKGILYIPKKAIDEPKNQYDVPEGATIAIQMNYNIGKDMDFSKDIHTQVMTGDGVKNGITHTDNIFDLDTLVVETGVTGRNADDISVCLNGQIVPIYRDAWNYDAETGNISIQALPGVVSNINIMFTPQTTAQKAEALVSSFWSRIIPKVLANDQVTTEQMSYFHLKNGEVGRLTFDRSKMFIGWRGHYSSAVKHTFDIKGYNGWDSVKYMYGAYTGFNRQQINDSATDRDKKVAPLWAIQSYAIAADVRTSSSGGGDHGVLEWNEQVTHYLYNSSTTETHTIYEWFMKYRNAVEKSGNNGPTEGNPPGDNDVGGRNDFLFHLPLGKVAEGSGKALAHPDGTPLANPNITFSSDNISGDLWFVASCSHLADAAASEEEGDVYVTCLALKDDYVVLAFNQVNSGTQNMSAIYKFQTQVPVKVKKVSSNTGVSDGNNCYGVAGAKFGIFASEAAANAGSGAIATVTTGADGVSNEAYVDPGKTYYFKELSSPQGYWLSDTVKAVAVNDSMTVSMADPPVVGVTDVVLKKVIHDKTNPSQGDRYNSNYDLSSAQFTVKYYDNLNGTASGSPKRTWILETNKKGELKLDDTTIKVGGDALYADSNGKQVWPIGTYTFEEKTPPPGFLKNTKVFKGILSPASGYQTNYAKPAAVWTMSNPDKVDSNIISQEADRAVAVTEPATFADLRVRKVDRGTGKAEPEGDGSFDKTVFSVINVSTKNGQPRMVLDTDGNFYGYGEEICKITTGADGVARTTDNLLQCGEGFKYKLVEVTPPEGYLLNKEWTTTVELKQSDEGKVVEAKIPLDEPVIRGGVKIHKDDNDLADEGVEGKDKPQGDATLAGAEFTIVNKSKKSVVVRNVPYLSDTTPTVNWDVPYVYPIKNGTKEVQPGEVVGIIRTDAKGDAATLARDLPYGTYEITETKASPGYKIDTTWFVRFEVRKEGVIVDKTVPHVEEPVIRGGVKIQKWDRELDKSEALGGKDHDATNHEGPDLNNIKFTIKNVSGHSVVTPKDIDASIKGTKAPTDIDYSPKKGKFADERLQEVKTGDVVGIMTTSWNEEDKAYEAWTQTDALPYGTYEVWESRTNKYYELTDKHVATFQIREDGTFVVDKNGKQTSKRDKVFFVTKDKSGNNLVWKDYAWRQGFEMTKIFDSHSGRGGYIPFKVTNLTTGEYHYVVTDANGYMNTEKIKHSQNTNAYDKMLDKAIAEGKTLTQADFKKMRLSEDGVDVTTPGYWFYLGEDGTKAPVDDNKAALPYGKYQIEEIKVDINKDYSMQKFDFWVNQDEDKSYDTNYQVVNLDTITDDEIEIKTTATDASTESHEGVVSKETTVVDEVEYKGLIAHKKYTMKGTLMKKVVNEDGTVTSTPLMTTVTKEDGTTEEAEVTAEKEFEAEAGGNGTVTLEFKFNSSDLGGTTVVAFEDLYQEGNKLATHSDINDKDQTVFFPDIRTVAVDKTSGTKVVTRNKNLLGREKATVVDTVLYSALVPGDRYKLEGTLMRVVTNEDGTVDVAPLKDKNGDAVTAEKTFKAEAENGSVELEFTFETKDMETAKIVVYEELSKNGKPIAEHKDPKDADQTVYLPEIKTSAADPNTDPESGLDMGILAENATIVDTVTYKNHAPGEYIMRGTLMDKVTGEPVKGADGKDITAEQPFTVGEGSTDGTVEITFNLDSTKLANPSVVVFEKDYILTAKSEGETPDEGGETPKKEVLVAEHEDINDVDQTVEYPNPKYDMYKIRTTKAPHKGDSDQYGFRPGDTVLYDVVVKNTGNVDITVDVSDEFDASAKDFFTEPTVKEVKNAVVAEEKAEEAEKPEATAEAPEATKDAESVEDKSAANGEEAKDVAETPDVAEATPNNDEGAKDETAKANDADKVAKVAEDVTAATEAAVVGNSKATTADLSGKGINKVTITVKAGETATVVYEAQVKFGVKELLAPAAADSDSLDAEGNDCNKAVQANTPDDKDGYWNTAKTENPQYPNPGKPGELIPVPDGPKDDTAQTPVQELKIHTTATDAESGEHVGLVRNEVKIQDKVEYESLTPGKTYTLVGTLMDKETGKPIVAGADAEKMKNGNSGNNSGSNANADLSLKGLKELVVGKDINPGYYVLTGKISNGTIGYWAIFFNPDGTVPTARDTDHCVGNGLLNNGETTIIRLEKNMVFQFDSAKDEMIEYTGTSETSVDSLDDGIRSFYKNNWVDGTYKSAEELLDEVIADTNAKIAEAEKAAEETKTEATEAPKASETKDNVATEKAADKSNKGTQNSGEVVVVKTFTANNANGSEILEFAFSGVDLSNKSVVAFERLYEGDKVDESKLVAVHEDLNDAAQTVVYPTIKTKANYSNNVITDTVTYTNLIPGVEYELSGVLMDKKSGDSTEITAMKKFTPEQANGSVDMTFEIDASKYAGKSLVVFETLKLNGKVVAEHKDINDKDQTVTIDSSKTPTKETKDSKDNSNSDSADRASYKTGDFLPYIFGGVLIVLVAAIAVVYRRRRQE